jgi:glycosyltransferase involved in cell wall biosynthesis
MFVVASRYMRSELLLNDYPDDRIVVVPPGTDDPAELVAPEISPLSDERPVVLFAGRLTRHKGVDLLVEALHHVRTPAHLVIAGGGPEGHGVNEAGQRLPARHSFTMTGSLDPGFLHEWYGRARLVVVPSMWGEPFGLVGIEAMAHARPVVAFDRGGVRQWLDEGVTGLAVRGGDVAALGVAIERLLSNHALAAALGAGARERFLTDFTARGHAERLCAVLATASGGEAAAVAASNARSLNTAHAG